ncbi:MAG: cytochrome c family protein [Nitrospirota bacterium]|nr:cytochrome c family protein [Nitrospirota bacterium]
MGCRRPWVAPLIWALTGLVIGILAWASPYDPEALWAPGDLSRYHTDIATCGSCHEPFRGATPQKCLACHTMEKFEARSEPDVRQLHQGVIQTGQSCLTCHTEHRGALTAITIGRVENPHGELIFRATGATSCSDCHMMKAGAGQQGGTLLRNAYVEQLIQKGEGAHRLGHFAKCLKCHRGGQLDVEGEGEGDKEDD